MLILACDTSTDYATFAIGTDKGALIAAYSFRHNRDLSRQFFFSMDKVLHKAGCSFSEIDVLAAGIGPGSFTGVRLTVTTFKTLAQASKKPLVAVGTLAVYARGADPDSTKTVVAILPSRKGEIYVQQFSLGRPSAPASTVNLMAFEAVLLADQAHPCLCGHTSCLPPSFDIFDKIDQSEPPASAMIALAGEEVESGNLRDFTDFLPVYAALPSISRHKNR